MNFKGKIPVNTMKNHIDFMMKIQSNPYYPVPIDQYSELFDFVLTQNGMIYFERLKKEYDEGNDLSEDEKLYLSTLHLAYATMKKSVKECHEWQAYMFLIGEEVNIDKSGIKENLKSMNCIADNPNYNPKLYKSHIIWKNEILDTIDPN